MEKYLHKINESEYSDLRENLIIHVPNEIVLKKLMGILIENKYRVMFIYSEPLNSYKDKTCLMFHKDKSKRVTYATINFFKNNGAKIISYGTFFNALAHYEVDELFDYFHNLKNAKNNKNPEIDPYEEEDWDDSGWLNEDKLNIKSYTKDDILQSQRKKFLGKTLRVYFNDLQTWEFTITDLYYYGDSLYIKDEKGEEIPVSSIVNSDNKITLLNKRREITLDDPFGEEDWSTETDVWEVNERKIAYKRKLNPKLFEDDKLKYKIREKLLHIANDFYEDLDIDVELLDIWLTGSIANYNYNAHSDIDIHLIVDYSEVNSDIELVEKAFDGERYVWNLRHNIVIYGYDVEIYVQNIKAKHASSGIYSIMNDEWVKKPEYNRPLMDQKDVDERYDLRVRDIEQFVDLSKEHLLPEEAEVYYKAARKLKKKIQKARSEGLEIIGEFSLENLVFKKLRKTGKFGKLINAIVRLYDKIYSQ